MDKRVGLSKGTAYVEFESRKDAEGESYMREGWTALKCVHWFTKDDWLGVYRLRGEWSACMPLPLPSCA